MPEHGTQKKNKIDLIPKVIIKEKLAQNLELFFSVNPLTRRIVINEQENPQ